MVGCFLLLHVFSCCFLAMFNTCIVLVFGAGAFHRKLETLVMAKCNDDENT
jgi:hypothetical protein